MWPLLRRLRRASYPRNRASLPAAGALEESTRGLVGSRVDLAGCQVFPGRLLARAQELETQPLNFLDEHQNRATDCGMFLTPRVSQTLAPAP